MKIEKIENVEWLFLVYLKPNFIERIFKVKPRVEKFKDSGCTFTYGGGTRYIREDGESTGNGSYVGDAIDKWRRKF